MGRTDTKKKLPTNSMNKPNPMRNIIKVIVLGPKETLLVTIFNFYTKLFNSKLVIEPVNSKWHSAIAKVGQITNKV